MLVMHPLATHFFPVACVQCGDGTVLQVPTAAVGLCQVLQVCSQHRPCLEWHCLVLDGCLLQRILLTAGAGPRLLTHHCMLGSMLWCVELGPVVRGLLECVTHQQLAAASTASKYWLALRHLFLA